MPASLFKKATEGTENRMFEVGDNLTLAPEVTNYIRAMGAQRMGANKVCYVARCFRDETTTDGTRLREFTQIGVELLGDNALDCRKVARKDAIKLFQMVLQEVETDRYGGQMESPWVLQDGAERGLNLYSDADKTFEISMADLDGPSGASTGRQLLGGGPYEGGAGWALGLERLMFAMTP